MLIARAAHLPPEDRELVLALYAHNRSISEVANLLKTDRRRVRARARHLIDRLLHPAFAFIVSARERAAAGAASPWLTWRPAMRAIAVECFLNGRSLRVAARAAGLTLYQARRMRDTLMALADLQPALRIATPRWVRRLGDAA